MGVVGTILLVVFVIVCILLILLVLVQNEDNNGMGSAFGGGNSAAFGAHQASVLTKATAVFVALFFVLAFTLGLLNRAPKNVDVSGAAQEVQGEVLPQSTSNENWLEETLGTTQSQTEEPKTDTQVIESASESSAE